MRRLVAALAQWHPEDPPFREIAFTILCLASGGKHLTPVLSAHMKGTGLYGTMKTSKIGDTEFVSFALTGSHLQGEVPTTPETTVHWLDSILVFLVSPFTPVDTGVSRIVQYYHEHHPRSWVDAVLMSIKHVVLVQVLPSGAVRHSACLDLFCTLGDLLERRPDAVVCSKSEILEAKSEVITKNDTVDVQSNQNHPGHQEAVVKPDSHIADWKNADNTRDTMTLSRHAMIRVEGSDKANFCALMNFIEAAARRRLLRSRIGSFPNEIYSIILSYVTDVETRDACLEVSKPFRDICQESFMFAEGVLFPPYEGIKACVEPVQASQQAFLMSDNLHALDWKVNIEKSKTKRGEYDWDFENDWNDAYYPEGYEDDPPFWTVAIGHIRGRKILLPDVAIRICVSPQVAQCRKIACSRCRENPSGPMVNMHPGGDYLFCPVPSCGKIMRDRSSDLRRHIRRLHLEENDQSGGSYEKISDEQAKELGFAELVIEKQQDDK